MKNALKVILIVLVCGYVSCSGKKDESTENFVVDMGSSTAQLIPKPAATSSCEQLAKGDLATGAVAGAYFTLPNPKISWTLPADKDSPYLSEVRVVALKLSLKSPKVGGDYSCVFSDLSLGSMYYKSIPAGDGNFLIYYWDTILGKGALAGNSTQNLITSHGYSACPLKCGGITVPPNTGQFSVTGVWEILAVRKKYTSETDYEEIPIKVQGDFTVNSVLN